MTNTSAPQQVRIDASAGGTLPAALARDAAPERLAVWETERALWAPRTLTAYDPAGAAVGAALTAGRPHSAYRKIVDVAAADDAVWAALVAAARDDAATDDGTRPAPIAVHFEEHPAFAPLSDARRAALGAAGFAAVAAPVPSIPSTRADDPAGVAAWSFWRGAAPTRSAPYYGQTTDVTCGAVASLMALEQRGNHAFSPDSLVDNRAAEIAFWRRATNLPACEPIGLAVETAKLGAETGVLPALPRVFLSTPDPVLIEEFSSSEGERALRTDLQLESLRQAEALGLPIERRWVDVPEIFEFVRGGSQVLLLIDLTELIADPTPHWVLATEVVGDTLLISDPWVNAPTGESWVDTFALPLPAATVDLVTRWGDPAYRGVIVLPGASDQ
ncbi:peptidase C39 family protein [Leucobacter luti]|uniref:Peptidase C3-like protein n=1 Tax=Leucobacter luti TaxID=340320 RepID=A0A4Q7U6D1_9MICO|nr:peptidase C39 family protein [Leucobacter luti]MBL3700660.1 hypothetical protein [Leucobacter luti]RZT68500.1 peptidase C3-like protein [Leucobacter luti]